MSRADSISPPPYSYENSSFVPPPPGVGQVSRSWDFQMRFEAAHEDVRWAILHTITAWKASREDQSWDHIPRNSIQDAYDSAPQNLKIALDYISQNNLTCYFNNDTDRRRHLYFSRRDAGWSPVGGPRILLSPDRFVREFLSVEVKVQKAVLMSIGDWERKRSGRNQDPHTNSSLQAWYNNALNDQKIMLNWLLEIGGGCGINRLHILPTLDAQIRASFNRIHHERQKARSLLRHFSP